MNKLLTMAGYQKKREKEAFGKMICSTKRNTIWLDKTHLDLWYYINEIDMKYLSGQENNDVYKINGYKFRIERI